MDNKVFVCRICRNPADNEYVDSIKFILGLLEICHNCWFWVEKISLTDPMNAGYDRAVRINGKHYMIGAENSTGPFRGFGGSLYTIRFFKGNRKEVKSTNLWTQGNIPERFKQYLPDNAEFVSYKCVTCKENSVQEEGQSCMKCLFKKEA